MSVVCRKFDSQKTNIDSERIRITHVILLPFHIKNHNQSNRHEIKGKKKGIGLYLAASSLRPLIW